MGPQLRARRLSPENSQTSQNSPKNARAYRQFVAGMLGRFDSLDEQGDEHFFILIFSDYDFCFCFTGEAGRHLDLLR